MRPFYDEGGYVILGQECRRCGRALFTRDAGVAFQPPEGAARRYTPAEPTEALPFRELAPAPWTGRGTPRDPIVCLCGCGVEFTPGPRQRYFTENCRDQAGRVKARAEYARRGKHDAPEMSGSNQ